MPDLHCVGGVMLQQPGVDVRSVLLYSVVRVMGVGGMCSVLGVM